MKKIRDREVVSCLSKVILTVEEAEFEPRQLVLEPVPLTSMLVVAMKRERDTGISRFECSYHVFYSHYFEYI